MNNLASISAGRRQFTKAREEREKVLAIRARLASGSPAIAHFRELADAHYRVGAACEDEGRNDKAEHHYREFARLRADLAGKNPDNVWLALQAGVGHNILADRLLEFGEAKEALESCRRAAAWLDPLWKKAETIAALRPSTTLNCQVQGAALMRLARFREAQASFERALTLTDAKNRDSLLLGRARALAVQGGHAKAAAEAEEVASRAARDGHHSFWAAATFASCFAAASRDVRLQPARREAIGAKYAGRALALLQQARKAGYFKGRALKADVLMTNEYLKPLHPLKEFQAFVADVVEDAKKR
jgi:tetratricopeptide (TPR) repeat protein